MESREHKSKRKKNTRQIWLSIGAVVLIILLILWLTDAMFTGDTDVSAPPIEAILLMFA
ncbi:MAG: hypothetical protein NC111_00265 [Bacteroides sp.]|nr:hypothetical protein [Bacteroides sp.]MCM1412756.1 hypothetical protein [Bacteroides sp.]MCM1470950.1 hypothetical protein [Bacteroides sp.]